MCVDVISISTHTPLAGRDGVGRAFGNAQFQFQLTRPLRGATVDLTKYYDNAVISTHTPLAGRDAILGSYPF